MRTYTWKPDLPDLRDHLFQSSTPALQHVDLRPKCTPVKDQGQLGSCTANALAGGAMEFLRFSQSGDATPLSRLFVYYNERAIEGTIRTDSGAQIRDGVKSLAKLGVCPESRVPYIISRFRRKPSKAAFAAALPNVISSYQRLTTLTDMLQCLSDGFPFVFGFTVYESFESEAVAKSGIVDMPARGERPLGGHAVTAVGYDYPTQRFIVRNSWGPDWGQGGYFTIPFAYLTNRNLSDDFWTIRK